MYFTTPPPVPRAGTPRSSLLEVRELTHHHHYARHHDNDVRRAGDGAARVVPLNHVSTALVPGAARPGADNRSPLGKAAGQELAELHDWTLKLTGLRSWRADAEKGIMQQDRDLRSLPGQKASANQEKDGAVALRGQLLTAQEELEDIREHLEAARRERDEGAAEHGAIKSQV